MRCSKRRLPRLHNFHVSYLPTLVCWFSKQVLVFRDGAKQDNKQPLFLIINPCDLGGVEVETVDYIYRHIPLQRSTTHELEQKLCMRSR